MRIAISGTACQGKTTLLNGFLAKYNTYTTPEKTYRDVLPEIEHSMKTTIDTQWKVLDFMTEQHTQADSSSNIIYDRCPLDNMVYSLWAHDKKHEGFDRDFIDKCIPLFRESMKFLDIILFLPITKVAPVEVVDDGTRETNEQYITEIDNLFKAMYQQWLQPESTFFAKDDKPAIIEIFGTQQERMHMIQLYVDVESGDAVDEQGILDPVEMDKIESQFRNTGSGYTDPNDVNRLLI